MGQKRHIPEISSSEDQIQCQQGSDNGEWNQVKVGYKCLVSIRGRSAMARGMHGDPLFKCGHTFWRFNGEENPPVAKLRLPFYFAYNPLRRGKRDDQIPLTNSFGEPLPQILALVAIHTGSFSDWVVAVQMWESVRSDLIEGLGDAAGNGLEFLKDQIEVLLPPPLTIISHTGDLLGQIARFERWAEQWIFTIVKSGALGYLTAWDEAARRSIKRLTLVRKDFHFVEQISKTGDDEITEMGRVLRAVKRATLVAGGVPYSSRVESILDADDGPKLHKERVRSILRTLGFDWIPRQAHWERDWAPYAQSVGWI